MPTCWYCEERSADPDSAFLVQLRGEKIGTRKTGMHETTTYYESRTVSVPRCTECYARHRKAKNLFFGMFLLAIVIWVAGCGLTSTVGEVLPDPLLVVYLIAVAALGIGGIVFAGKVRPSILSGSKGEGEATQRHPEVRRIADQEGWRAIATGNRAGMI